MGTVFFEAHADRHNLCDSSYVPIVIPTVDGRNPMITTPPGRGSTTSLGPQPRASSDAEFPPSTAPPSRMVMPMVWAVACYSCLPWRRPPRWGPVEKVMGSQLVAK